MKTLLTLSGVLALSQMAVSAATDPADLVQIRQMYQQAKQDRLQQLNQQYLDGLKKLLSKHSTSGDENATKAVAMEIARIEADIKAPDKAAQNLKVAEEKKVDPPKEKDEDRNFETSPKAKANDKISPKQEARLKKEQRLKDLKSILGEWYNPARKTTINFSSKGRVSSSAGKRGKWRYEDGKFTIDWFKTDMRHVIEMDDGKLEAEAFSSRSNKRPISQGTWIRREK